jgi:very-short-patch-repair endonuclease
MTLRLTEEQYRALKAKKKIPKASGSRWESQLAAQLDAAGITYARELRFLRERKFRFDFAFPGPRVAVEIDGVVHRTAKRFASDREKLNLAMLAGWRVLHVTSANVRDGRALALIRQLLG